MLQLSKMKRWDESSKVILEKANLLRTERNGLCGSLFFVGIHHARAITLLIQHRRYTSSLALLRPLIEAFFRAGWIKYCSTEAQLELLLNGQDLPGTTARRSRQLAKIKPHYGRIDAQITRIFGNTLHELTHGGSEQIFNQSDGITITDAHDLSNVYLALKTVSLIWYFCIAELLDSSIPKDLLIELQAARTRDFDI
ncbi:hypothetical protein HLB01_04515 [Bordetella trematum]|uniref:DUF6988 family protein n=1 Tax=Bordetella trematum TaxID=123899 RepID=UPI0011C08352|nr:hypothetical protein [Bordetella trematum]NNH18299.1 hypothetical protein [Bordetella trematum]